MAAISSTMVIRKTFEDIEVDPRVSRLVYGILIFEDIAAILLLATLTAVAAGEEVTFAAFVGRGLRLAGFLVALTIAGLFLVPRLVRFVLRMQSTETTAIAAVGICFAFAVLARSFGYSVALGAFIAGAVVAESGKSRVIDAAIRPVRDLFAAVFFVSIGMLVDLGQVWESWPAVLVFTGIVVVGKGLGVTAGAMLTGHRPQVAVRAAMSMMQIGEFSLLMAGLAAGLGPAGAAVAPVAVAVTVLTTFITPWAVRWSGWTAEHFDRWLPARVQTFVTLWGTWIEGAPAPAQAPRRDVRRLVFLLAVDALILAGVSIAVSLNLELLVQRFHAWTGVRDAWIETGVIVLAILACFPFARGIVACARRLGQILSERALPLPGAKGLDLALAPRIGLALGLQSGIVLVVLLFVLALTQPFLPSLPSIGALVLALALIAFLIWRNAASLQGHARAGAEMVVEILARQSHDEQPPDLQPMRAMLPGLGELTPVEITAGCRGADQTLAELNVRGATGTSVVCITRGDQGLVFPSQDERLLPGDVVVLSGKRRALRDARELLAGPSSAKTGRG